MVIDDICLQPLLGLFRNGPFSGFPDAQVKFVMYLQAKKYKVNKELLSFPNLGIQLDVNKTFIGYFNGLFVEVWDSNDMTQIHNNGCFGIGSITKAAPMVTWKNIEPRKMSTEQYNQRLQWNEKFATISICVEESENLCGNDFIEICSPAIQTIENKRRRNPFPLKESLILFLEEAFFLHFALNCLQILMIDKEGEKQTLTTSNILLAFCKIKPSFFTQYVAYQYLKSKLWIVKSGLKFGADFVLYKDGPRYYHASCLVHIVEASLLLSKSAYFQCLYRIAETTKKELIILEIYYPHGLSSSSNPLECLRNIKSFKVSNFSPKRLNF